MLFPIMNLVHTIATYSSPSAGGNAAAGGVLLLLLGLGLAVWLIPGFIASVRHHHNQGAIWCLTIFLGWTFVGWVIALVWAFTNPPIQVGPVVISNNR
jgi:T4 superinfection immunity protein